MSVNAVSRVPRSARCVKTLCFSRYIRQLSFDFDAERGANLKPHFQAKSGLFPSFYFDRPLDDLQGVQLSSNCRACVVLRWWLGCGVAACWRLVNFLRRDCFKTRGGAKFRAIFKSGLNTSFRVGRHLRNTRPWTRRTRRPQRPARTTTSGRRMNRVVRNGARSTCRHSSSSLRRRRLRLELRPMRERTRV